MHNIKTHLSFQVKAIQFMNIQTHKIYRSSKKFDVHIKKKTQSVRLVSSFCIGSARKRFIYGLHRTPEPTINVHLEQETHMYIYLKCNIRTPCIDRQMQFVYP